MIDLRMFISVSTFTPKKAPGTAGRFSWEWRLGSQLSVSTKAIGDRPRYLLSRSFVGRPSGKR